jgi:anti-anti-sigma factor
LFDLVRSDDGTSHWQLVGELDLATAGDLHTVLLPWLEQRPTGEAVTFDASRLTFIDSTGVRTLYSLTGPPHNARIILRNPTEPVWRALGLVGLTTDADEPPQEVAIEHLGHWEPI